MQPSSPRRDVPETFVALPHVRGQMRQSSLVAVAALVNKHPEETLAVLRRWLEELEQP